MPFYSTFSFFHVVEALLFGAVVLFFFIRRRKPKPKKEALSDQQKDAIIAEWKPETLVPFTDPNLNSNLNPKLIDGKMGKVATIDGKTYLNMATNNFLGFVGDKRIEEVAKSTIFKYGVGSCGPRSFYGTVDVHLALEKQLAEFMHCEDAVLYSYGFATIASAIPAYAKRNDIIYLDKGVNFAIQTGVQASRSKVEWFEHNNMDDLEHLLKAQEQKDKKNPKVAAKTRRFIIVEGLYAKTGDLCPLKKIMEFKWKYKIRVFVDESLSFGVIGNTGRGVTEHFGVDVIDVDMIMASLENAIASTGGFCCGRIFVMEHQRLSGLGYCFSASLPPLLTTAAGEAVRIMSEEPDKFARLKRNAMLLHDGLVAACKESEFRVQADEISPLKHLVHSTNNEAKLDALVNKMFNDGILITRAKYLNQNETFQPISSVKIMCNSEMNSDEVANVSAKIRFALQNLH